MKAREGVEPKAAALSRRSELLRVERVDAVATRWMPSKSAVELAGNSRLALETPGDRIAVKLPEAKPPDSR